MRLAKYFLDISSNFLVKFNPPSTKDPINHPTKPMPTTKELKENKKIKKIKNFEYNQTKKF